VQEHAPRCPGDRLDFDEFIKQIQRTGPVRHPQARRAGDPGHPGGAGERLACGEPSDLAAQLSGELAELARYDGPAESFDTAEFYRRVADREGAGCTPGRAREHAMAVMSTVVDQVSEGERGDLAAQLPADYGELLR